MRYNVQLIMIGFNAGLFVWVLTLLINRGYLWFKSILS